MTLYRGLRLTLNVVVDLAAKLTLKFNCSFDFGCVLDLGLLEALKLCLAKDKDICSSGVEPRLRNKRRSWKLRVSREKFL